MIKTTEVTEAPHEKYIQEFNKIIAEDYSWFSLTKPKIDPHKKIDSNINLSSAIDNFLSTYGYPSLQISAGQCVKWCHFLEKVVANIYGMKAWVTLGQFHTEHISFTPTREQLQKWVKKGIHAEDMNSTGFNAHAWLTLENGMILDLTILSSFAMHARGAWSSVAGQTLIGYDNIHFDKIYYKPLLVGFNAVSAIGKKSSIPIISNNFDDPDELLTSVCIVQKI